MGQDGAVDVLLIGSGRGAWVAVTGARRHGWRALTVTSEGDVERALTLAAALQPGVALVEATASAPVARLVAGLNARCPACKVALLGDLLPRAEHARLRPCRVQGYLLWGDLGPGGVVKLARDLRQETYLRTSAAVVAQARTLIQVGLPAGCDAASLGANRLLVLRALVSGYKMNEVPGITNLPEGTVRRHVTELHDCLDAPTQAVLGMRAVQLGIVPWTPEERAALERARDERGRERAG